MTNHNYDIKYFNDKNYQSSKHCDQYFLFLSNLIPNIKNKKCLDIGCATGLFIKNFDNKDCLGVDISPFAIEQACQNFPGKKFSVFDINNEKLVITDVFDIITLFDVIEHMYNYMNLNEIIKNNLVKDGFLVVTTPNSNSILRFLSPSNFTGEIDKTHTMLFTPYTLDFFLGHLGLNKVCFFTPFRSYIHNDIFTKNLLLGGQIFAVYKKE